MDEVRLKRTGQLPLVFTGELIKEADGKWVAGKDHNRWHEIKLYQTEQSKQFVLAVTFHSQWQGEDDYHDVLILGTDQQRVINVLRDYDPVPDYIGFPRSDHFSARQAALEADLRRRFASLVSEILDGVEGAEERID